MQKRGSTDYETYREIMQDLLQPIASNGLDEDTLKRLYESKLVYLENLRQKCFIEINSPRMSYFNSDDQALILDAIQKTKVHLKDIILMTIVNNLSRRKVS